jgi:hypothetical protein
MKTTSVPGFTIQQKVLPSNKVLIGSSNNTIATSVNSNSLTI